MTQPMNILMLSDVYFPRVNGVSASMRTFARELVQLGHAVTIVAPDYGVADHRDEFETLRVPARVIFFDPEDRLMRASGLRAAAHALSQHCWDVVHVHTPFRAHQLGVWLKRRLGCALVESYHTFFEEYAAHYLPWFPPSLLRLAARRLSRHLCSSVDHLIIPTAQMAEVLKRYGITTPHSVIPTGLHLDEFRGGDGTRFRREHGIAPDRPTLVTVSRLAAEKNIGFLLEVTRVLVADFPDLLFIIAGEGPDADRLRSRALALGLHDNVRFVGNLDRRTALLDCYRAGDVFVFASPTETQGLVLLEAMSLGVPIVSTAVMGTATVLANARSARISAENIEEFARVTADVLRSPEQRARLSAAGPADASHWSAPMLIQRVEELYRRLSSMRPDTTEPQQASARASARRRPDTPDQEAKPATQTPPA
jgi:glycosyltransferase involved in cell wall biosynthesis